MNKEEAKDIIETLVERFKEHRGDYHLPDYNEQKTRQDFINPFFKALGWDIDNEKGDSEAYREVIYEDKVIVKGKAKAPDYGFRLSGSGKKRLFYVEAKKPSVSLKANREAAYQLRRYGSSAQAHVSIVTNFEDFIIYDCSRVPNLNDSATVARLKHIHFEDYIKEFDFIYDTFSHEAVTKGRFDKFVQAGATKKGTDTLDKRFVQSLDEWRKYLAVSIAINNRKLGDEEINFAVQQTIDRLIFLRFCEDRAVEPYGQLQKAVSKGDAYKHLFDLFKQADDKYNSGLFDFKKDTITQHLKVDNKVIRHVIDELYYPKCNYEFSVMPVEILGNAYEQFLGKVIRITPARTVKIEEKPEVRKAGGVYYTPQYIVEYIVKNTVGKIAPLNPPEGGRQSITPDDIAKIKICDPACGSGSFLLGAYQYLLDWHTDYYHHHPKEAQKRKALTPSPPTGGRAGEGLLTTHEKKRILLSNIYGVDIDANAVEVTKLSLLLKCMEGETEASIKQQISLFHERVLPDLDNNIKNGNSLVETDVFDSAIDFGEDKKIKPFSWKHAFPNVFKQGGFDAVIGNPPYVFGRDWKSLGIGDDMKAYFGSHYKSSPYQLDLFSIFMEKGVQLMNESGFTSFIVPNVWLTNTYSSSTRKFLISNAAELKITVPESKVFEGVTVDTIIYILRKGKRKNKSLEILKLSHSEESLISELNFTEYANGEKPISTSLSKGGNSLIEKIKNNKIALGELADITRGVHSYRIGGFGKSAFGKGEQIQRDVDERPYHSDKPKSGYRPFVYGKDLKCFTKVKPTDYISYGKWLAEPRDEKFFEGDRIYSRKILGETLIVTIEKGNTVADQQVYITKPRDNNISVNYLSAILGSKLISFFIRNYFDEVNDAFPQIKVGQLKSLPIIIGDKKNQTEIIKHVDLLLELHEELIKANLQNKQEQIKQRIAHSEEKINELVYELYELTEEEIKIVES